MGELMPYCQVCNGKSFKPISKFQHEYLVKCTTCDFVFCSKKPSLDELTAHYLTYSRSDDISPLTIRRYKEILNRFESFRKTNNILDIGCGNGHFLVTAKEMGWNVYGTEFSDDIVKLLLSKGLTIHQGELSNAKWDKNTFDVITSFEVIEHINNADIEIAILKRFLRRGGVHYITTPNFNGISKYIVGKNWRIVEYPEHLSYYTPETLNRLLTQNNFKKLSLVTTGMYLSGLKNLDDTIDHHQTTEALRIKAETNWFLGMVKNLINSVLSMLNLGDSMKAIYINDK